MGMPPSDLPEAALGFLTERHLATLTTLRPDGSPHVVAVGFTFEPGPSVVRIITFAGSRAPDRVSRSAAAGRSVTASSRTRRPPPVCWASTWATGPKATRRPSEMIVTESQISCTSARM